jgi:hypothetical protein
METTDGSTFLVEASVSGDFHDPGSAPHTTVVEPLDPHAAVGGLVGTRGGETIELLDMEPGDAAPPVPALPQPAKSGGSAARNPPHKRKGSTLARSRSVGRVPRSGPGAAVTRTKSRSSRTKKS